MYLSATTPPTRLPIMLSALVFPGAGQLAQKRWVAGAFYMLSFTVSLGMSIWHFFRIIISYLSIADFSAPTRPPPGYARFLAWLGASFALYIISLIDTILAQNRARRRQAPSRLPPPLPPA